MNANAVKEAIAKGVSVGLLAYVGKSNGDYEPFAYNSALNISEVEISEDAFIVTKETAEEYLKSKAEEPADYSQKTQQTGDKPTDSTEPNVQTNLGADTGENYTATGGNVADAAAQSTSDSAARNIKNLTWEGDLSLNDWNRFYSKVLNKLGTSKNIRATVRIETDFADGVAASRVEEVKSGLRELNLPDEINLLFEE
jgi:hypothetical protein